MGSKSPHLFFANANFFDVSNAYVVQILKALPDQLQEAKWQNADSHTELRERHGCRSMVGSQKLTAIAAH